MAKIISIDIVNEEINRLFIDFDGVILDTPNYIEEFKKQLPNIRDDEFYANLDWVILLEQAKPINDSLNILKKLRIIYRRIYILTKVNSIREQIEKIRYLRRNEINIPIITVPPTIRKSEIIIPDNNDLLVDDKEYNVEDWINSGGIAYLFDTNNIESKYRKIATLKTLIKK